MTRGGVWTSCAALAVGLAWASDAHAASDREQARLILLDRCVTSTASTDNRFTGFADTCKCAARKTSRQLDAGQIASVISSGRPRGAVSRIWNEARRRCSS